MAVDLAKRLKDHMMYLLTKKLADEYADQTEKWKSYIDDVADYTDSATKRVEDTLAAANAEQQAAREKAFGYAMLLLNMIAGPAVSWLGSAIAVKYTPMLLEAKPRIGFLTKAVWSWSATGRRYRQFIPFETIATFDMPIAIPVATDAVKGVAGWLIDQGMQPFKPKAEPVKPLDATFVQNSFTWQSFKNGLNKELYRVQQSGRAQMQSLADSVEWDTEFGEKLVARLFKQQPGLKGLKDPHADGKRETAGQLMIDKMLDDQRAIWANQWFYYGNNPPKVKANLDLICEREIWAQWLQDQHIQLSRKLKGGAKDYYEVRYHVESDSDYLMTDAVQDRLRRIALPNLYDSRTWDVGLNKAVIDVGEIEDQRLISYPTRAQGEAQDKAAKNAVDELLTWAKTHVPELGPLDYGTPREVGQIRGYRSDYNGNYKQN